MADPYYGQAGTRELKALKEENLKLRQQIRTLQEENEKLQDKIYALNVLK